jgi:hypothetical protein
VSISRRGLIAAGLALATAGTVGVASTLNAGAAQIEPPPAVATTADTEPAAATTQPTTPAAEQAAGTPSPAAEPAARKPRAKARRTPPSTLPWGAKPRTARKAGAAGLNADRATTSGAETSGEVLEPEPEYEPKGRPAVDGVSPGLVTKGARAATATNATTGMTVQALATTPPPAPSVNFFYSSGHQIGPTDGTYATFTIGRPWLSKRDYHSLAEVAVRSLDGRQIVEVGWTIDRDVNDGSAEPHLFVYHWVNRKESCYNGCGFVQYSPNVKPGDPLQAGTAKRFAIQHFGSAWWIAYDNEWIGYYPDELWSGTYTKGGLTQWFGEVAASSLAPCTDMGNGLDPTVSENAATITEVNFLNGPLLSLTLPLPNVWYPTVPVEDDPKAFRFGGKGAC